MARSCWSPIATTQAERSICGALLTRIAGSTSIISIANTEASHPTNPWRSWPIARGRSPGALPWSSARSGRRPTEPRSGPSSRATCRAIRSATTIFGIFIENTMSSGSRSRTVVYLPGIHPLELWFVTYLRDHPRASRAEVTKASEEVRQEVYGWLFKGHSTHKQDLRIRILQDWQRQGYPFGHLVPSYGSAIGSSGDRPDALADLMGIILNDGVRLPTVDLQRLDFAAGTPYETDIAIKPEPQRVLSTAVAERVRRALLGVVAEGTAERLGGTYHAPNGSVLPVGGKTGTGDNRFDRFGAG